LPKKKRSKEKGPENANFSRFLRSLHSAFTRHEKRLQFAPFSVCHRTTHKMNTGISLKLGAQNNSSGSCYFFSGAQAIPKMCEPAGFAAPAG